MNASQGRFRCVLVLAMLLLSGTTGYSQDDETPKKSENAKRLAFMSEVVEAFRLSPKEAKPGIARRFQNRPIMRYSDPTRGLVDATLWKLGSGRPQAIVTLELDRPVNEGDRLTYEFLSLTPEPFTLTTSHGWVWNPEDADSQFRRAEKTRAPAAKAAGRLQQMKRLARRFSVSEDLEGEESVLRLLPRPIDQYTVTDAGKKRSGTLFVFVHGTNPEALLLIESTDSGWQYGLARLTGAAVTVKLDGKVVWTKRAMAQLGYSWNSYYTADRHDIESP